MRPTPNGDPGRRPRLLRVLSPLFLALGLLLAACTIPDAPASAATVSDDAPSASPVPAPPEASESTSDPATRAETPQLGGLYAYYPVTA